MANMFRRRRFETVGGQKKQGTGRASYDAKWDRLSLEHRRRHPFCRFCEQEGFECVTADCTDHIIPFEKPFNGGKYDRSNLQSLCNSHHYGEKARLQHYAKRTGQIDRLPEWCDDPSTRPDMTVRPDGPIRIV